MKTQDEQLESGGGELNMLLRTLWQERGTVVAVGSAVVVTALAYALMASEIYRAEALVKPREASGAPAAAVGLAAQLGGIAELAGIAAGGNGDREVALAVLRSRALIQTFITEKKLLPKLYRNKWDEDAGRWKSDDQDEVPTAWDAYGVFTKDILRILENKKSGLVTVAIEWTDPTEAEQWTTDLIARTNSHLRSEAIREAESNLQYLEVQAQRIGQLELQRALYGLIEAEQKKLMLARGGEEFAIKTIDPAVVPHKRIWPRRFQIVALGLVVGGIVGVLSALIRRSLRW